MNTRAPKRWTAAGDRNATKQSEENECRRFGFGGGAPSALAPAAAAEAEEEEGPPMERDLTKPVFYVVPFAWLDNLMPARKGEEAMQAIVKEHQARIDDNSYPVFYVVPKPLITSVFPKYKDANSQSSAPPALSRGRCGCG
jgi:hypothetical protein